MMAGSAIGGRLAELRGPRVACVAGSLLSFAGFAWLAIPVSGAAGVGAAASLILAGAGIGLANAPSQSAALGAVDRAVSATASSVIWISRYLGGVAGITMLATLLEAPGAAQSLASYEKVVAVLAGCVLVASAVALSIPGRSYTASR
jgi:hypothetical protein